MGFFTASDLNELKSQYRKMAFQYHPDMGGNAKMFSEMKAEYESLFRKFKDIAYEADPEHNKKWDFVNSDELDDGYMRIIDLLVHLANIDIELCGGWLWLTGDTKSVKEQLKACGCHWAPKKKMWYWRPSDYSCRYNRHVHSMEYIRGKYGSQKVVSGKNKELEA